MEPPHAPFLLGVALSLLLALTPHPAAADVGGGPIVQQIYYYSPPPPSTPPGPDNGSTGGGGHPSTAAAPPPPCNCQKPVPPCNCVMPVPPGPVHKHSPPEYAFLSGSGCARTAAGLHLPLLCAMAVLALRH